MAFGFVDAHLDQVVRQISELTDRGEGAKVHSITDAGKRTLVEVQGKIGALLKEVMGGRASPIPEGKAAHSEGNHNAR